MEDAKYINRCNHKIVCEPITITRVSGSDRLYEAYLPYPAITTKATTFIRNYNDEKSYLSSNATYTDVLSCSYHTITGAIEELPRTALMSSIGITNFEFDSQSHIVFGRDSKDTTIHRVVADKLLVPQPIYLIDYNVVAEKCPLCGGTGIMQNIEFNGTGGVLRATGTQKLIQTVVKALLTPQGDSAEDIRYGSALDNLVGSTIDKTVQVSIQKAVMDTLNYIMELQSGEDLTEEERLTGLASLNIVEDEEVPTKINLKVVVLDGNGNEVPCLVSLGV